MKINRMLLALVPLSLAGTTLAQVGPGPGPRPGYGPGPRPHPVIRALDADQNHEISPAELANAPAALRALDKNNDGSVSVDELRPARPADAPQRPTPPADAPAGARPVDPLMLALDANSDGALSDVEIANATQSLGALDANKDGKLSFDEIRPLPPEGAPVGQGPGGPRRPRS